MRGTFRPGDLLEIEKSDVCKLRKGDIIVFSNKIQSGKDQIVHRIVKIEKDKIVTRGDNNPEPDNLMISEENLTGVVTGLIREKGFRRVRRGSAGIFSMFLIKVSKKIKRFIFLTLMIPYHLLRISRVGRLYTPRSEKIVLNSKNGLFIKMRLKNKIVANWYPEKNFFHCKKPFDIFIDKPEFNQNKYNEIISGSLLRFGFVPQKDEFKSGVH